MRHLALVAFLAMLAQMAAAQTDTGRHRRRQAEPRPEPPAAAVAGPWTLALHLGMGTSGDLFRVRADRNSGVPWDSPSGVRFESDDWVATLDEGLAFGASLARDLVGPLRLRLDASYQDLGGSAVAREGEVVNVYQYGDLSVALVSLSLEVPLGPAPSYPYLIVGGGFTSASLGEFDATGTHVRLGGGYHLQLGSRFGLRGEIKDAWQQLDFADYRPPVVGNVVPDYSYQERGPQHLVELTIGATTSF